MIGRTLSHYQVLEKLGEGGMGVVYKARDTVLDRTVAIKVLQGEQTSPDRRRRFFQEARAASALNHSGIVTIYDLLRDDGCDYLVMEFVDGRTLDQLTGRDGLSLDDALRFATQIADALAVAHCVGIVHRDLKPANVMVTAGGTVKLLDFGLAKLTDPSPSDLTVTQAGLIVGTLSYMSPEQATGQPVDARSDIFSFGALLYEMLSGRRAFGGPTSTAVLYSVLHEDPPALGGGISSEVSTIVKRCLRKNPAERYRSILEVKNALEELTDAPRHAKRMPSIVVLPFSNVSADPENDYFCDGLAEEIINALAHLPGLHVTARTSAFTFKGKAEDVRSIGRKLNVDKVLEGSVRKAGDRVRVTAQLVDVGTGYQLWSQRFDRRLQDIFAIQEEIAAEVVSSLQMQLGTQACCDLFHCRSHNLEAYDLLMKGRYFLERWSEENVARGLSLVQRAIELDPTFAAAYGFLSDSYVVSAIFSTQPARESMQKARAAALRALELDDQLASAHMFCGYTASLCEWDDELADRHFRRALELNPGDALAHGLYSHVLDIVGRSDEARQHAIRACELDPLSPMIHTFLGFTYLHQELWDEALRAFSQALELYPNLSGALSGIPYAWAGKGKWDRAFETLDQARAVFPDLPELEAWAGYYHACVGRRAEAEESLRRLEETSKERYVCPLGPAMIHGSLGRIERMFELLHRGADERDFRMRGLRALSLFRPLLATPRGAELLARLKLPPM